MVNKEQIKTTYTFANTLGVFINQDGVQLFMDHWKDGHKTHNSFFIYDDNGIKNYLGEINFLDCSSDFDSFIDGEVIYDLKEKGVL